MSATLIDTFKWWAIERADVPAIVVSSDSVTYAQLDNWAEAVAAWLEQQGLQRGDRVAVIGTNSLEWAVLAQGVMLAGGILAPVNPRFTVSEASYMVAERYQARFVFHDAERATLAAQVAKDVPDAVIHGLDAVRALREASRAVSRVQAPQRNIGPDDDVVIISTSGSTGRPKGVVYTHRTLCGYMSDTCMARPAAIDRARVLMFAPLCTSAGYVQLTQYLAYGGTVYLEEAFDPQAAITKIIREKMTTVMGTPIFFERMAACEEFRDADLTSIRYSLVGGAPVSRQLLQAWLDKGVLLRQLYGQTEAGGQATFNSDEGSLSSPEKCGRGSPYTRIAIIDEKGHFCAPDTPGEIVIRGPGVMARYWNDAEATAKTLVDGWLRTGDLGKIDEAGSLTMLDRIKDIIISGGLNISAAEVERVIAEVPGVREVAVIAASDDRFGETPLAVISGEASLQIDAVIAHCNAHLSGFKVPRYMVISTDPLPRLATGKLAKPALRAQYANAHQTLERVR
ncbi:class I adenylate-forming enzyme family protein [Paraburkholderia bannensis]|uniref:class I adenylate-forming enzyme family protein n=1 Tax=Paraburkholderia bannensis TaxID=765414 RepID=UPI002AB604F8|nr:class I adenylate-forming enzyme family protein [Paraburkholderia bannensis]